MRAPASASRSRVSRPSLMARCTPLEGAGPVRGHLGGIGHGPRRLRARSACTAGLRSSGGSSRRTAAVNLASPGLLDPRRVPSAPG